MSYKLAFVPSAFKEWKNLDNSIKELFKKQLEKRLELPAIVTAKIRDKPIKCYKIKLRKIGYRLVYTVEEDILTVLVLVINRRDIVYEKLDMMLKDYRTNT